MNYHDWESAHGLPLKWSMGDQFSQTYFPYLHDPGETFDEEFSNSQDWNSPSSAHAIAASFPMAFIEDPCKSSLLPRTTTVCTSVNSNMDRTNHTSSEEPEDEDDGDLMSDDYKTSPEAFSPATKNDYKPAWQTTSHTYDVAITQTPLEPSKRRRLSKSFDEDSSSLNTTSAATRRRSQRKPPPSAKASQPYTTEISTDPSSPDMTQPKDLDSSREASLKSKRCHNLTEKKYRNRLNGYFDTLLSAIPSKPGTFHGEAGAVTDVPGKKISKGEVLMLALEHIRALEKQNEVLRGEKSTLGSDVERLKGTLATFGGDGRI